MFFDICLVAGGLVLLFVGGEALVRGSIVIAEQLGLSKLLIGLVIVGFGTSMPELLVSLKAAGEGSPDIALGNVIGSNTANILLIFGVATLLLPIANWNRTAVRDALVATLSALALFGFVHGDVIGLREGVAFLMVLISYLAASYWIERSQAKVTVFEHETEEFQDIKLDAKWLPPLLVVGGIVMLVIGAELLVNGSVAIARAHSVPETIIGLSLVALGTSLPELATAIVAAIRKHSDVVLGNIIGSNIFNALAILGTTVVIHPISVNRRFQDIDAPVMLAASFFLLVLLFATKRIGRVWGGVMLASYFAYMAHLYTARVSV